MRYALPIVLLLPLVAIAAEQPSARHEYGTVGVNGPIAQAQMEEISAELAALDRAALADDDWAKHWAGVYGTRDAMTSNPTISIAPKSGIAYTSYGCLGMDGADWGEIVETFPGGIRVKLARTQDEKPHDYLRSTLYFVRWGNHQFLVPQRQMTRLVANYNAGGQRRDRMPGIPRRLADNGRLPNAGFAIPSGRPQLPAEFAALDYRAADGFENHPHRAEGRNCATERKQEGVCPGRTRTRGRSRPGPVRRYRNRLLRRPANWFDPPRSG